jgi:hypothetical protein
VLLLEATEHEYEPRVWYVKLTPWSLAFMFQRHKKKTHTHMA